MDSIAGDRVLITAEEGEEQRTRVGRHLVVPQAAILVLVLVQDKIPLS